jgi:hypothetical protein
MYNSPCNDRIPTELIRAGGKTLRTEIYKLVHFICNAKELPDQWKEYIFVQIYKKNNKQALLTNYPGISLLSNSCQILANIFSLKFKQA